MDSRVAFGTRSAFGVRNKAAEGAAIADAHKSSAPGKSAAAVRVVVLPKEAADPAHPYQLIHCNIQFVKHLLYSAHFLPEEIAPGALWSYHVDYYVSQAGNGGHGHYLASGEMAGERLPGAAAACRNGLRAMGLDDHLALYDTLLSLINSDPSRAERFVDRYNRRLVNPAIDVLDQQFRQLPGKDRLILKNRDFLLSLPELRLVPAAEWRQAVEDVARSNPKVASRADAERRAKNERDAQDPHIVTARALCEEAGRLFCGFTSLNPGCKLDGVPVEGWFLATDKGPAVAFFLGDEAVLCRQSEDVPRLDALSPDEAMTFLAKTGPSLASMYVYERLTDGLAIVSLAKG